tara:strand:+ start:531 stop:821 length:291 start_codon:yes stop_codon:yes gene_type:complete
MDLSDIKTVSDLFSFNEVSTEQAEADEIKRLTGLVDDVFDAGPDFGIMLCRKVLKSLVTLQVEKAMDCETPEETIEASVAGTKIGSAYALIKDVEL